MDTKLAFQASAATALLVLSLTSVSFGQPAPATPIKSRIQVVHVKPEMLNEWLDLQKNEVVPALKKGGWTSRTVYSTSIGNGTEFLIVRPFGKFAEFDGDGAQVKALGAAGAARLAEKLRKCTDSNSNYVITRLEDISNTINGAAPPAMIVSTRVRITAGKMQDFQTLVKTDVLPVYKKAKVALTVNHRGLGANPNDVTITSPIGKYADLEPGSVLVQTLGQDGAAKVLSKFTGIATQVETLVRSRVAELSF